MFNQLKKIPSSDEIKQIVPISQSHKELKAKRDKELKDIISGVDKRFLIIAGPCSADKIDSVCEYVARLGKIQEQVKDKIMIIPRIYTNKPRTKGVGYKGIFSQPDPHADPDIERGIIAIRQMHVKAMDVSGLTSADEMLYPDNTPYIDDVLTYITIGARSSENQQHRLVASGIDVPVGIKNTMCGNLSVLLNSIYAAQQKHIFKYGDDQVETTSNPYAHAILRGAVDLEGRNVPNYHYEDLIKFISDYKKAELKNPAIIIDANHSNSDKNHKEQIRICKEVINSMKYNKEISKYVKGFMIESYLADGAQNVDGGVYGKSITDACIGWEDTEKLILNVASKL